jgi:hypothetical protein
VTRVLVCVPGVPHKSRGASTVLFYYYIDGLKQAGYHVFCLLLLERQSQGEWDVGTFRAEMEAPGSV